METLLTDHDMEFLMEFSGSRRFWKSTSNEEISKELKLQKKTGTHKARGRGEGLVLNLGLFTDTIWSWKRKGSRQSIIWYLRHWSGCERGHRSLHQKQISDMLIACQEQIQENTTY